MKKVKKGQIWEHTDRRRSRRVRVLALSSLSCGRPYATVENIETAKRTRISLDRFRPGHNWRLIVDQHLPQEEIPGTNPIAPETVT